MLFLPPPIFRKTWCIHPKSKCVLKGRREGIEKQCSDSLQQAAAAAMSERPAPARTITPRHTAARAPTLLIVLTAPALAAPTTSLRSNLTETGEHYAKSAGEKQWPGKNRRQDSSPSFHRRRNAGHGEEVKFRETVSRISRQQPAGKGEEKITALLMLFLTWRRPPRAAL